MAKHFTRQDLEAIKVQFMELVEGRDVYFVLVDKQTTARRTVYKALCDMGAEKELIKEANDGVDALVLMKSIPGMVVLITELAFPAGSMDAIDLIRQFRSKPDHKDDPVVVITAEKKKERLAALQPLAVTYILNKPFEPKVFTERIKSLQVIE